MSAILPYLLLLACPIAMIVMMRGMHGRGGHAAEQHPAHGQRGILKAPNGTELAALSEQRDQLEARVQELEAQVSRLEWTQKAETSV